MSIVSINNKCIEIGCSYSNKLGEGRTVTSLIRNPNNLGITVEWVSDDNSINFGRCSIKEFLDWMC